MRPYGRFASMAHLATVSGALLYPFLRVYCVCMRGLTCTAQIACECRDRFRFWCGLGFLL